MIPLQIHYVPEDCGHHHCGGHPHEEPQNHHCGGPPHEEPQNHHCGGPPHEEPQKLLCGVIIGHHHCGHHHCSPPHEEPPKEPQKPHRDPPHEKRQKLTRPIIAAILVSITLTLPGTFLIRNILRPTKPRFILQNATVYAFNLSSTCDIPSPTALTPNALNLTMQVTLSALNPNSRIGMDYHNLHVYASYRGQKVSLATELPPSYQGHRDTTVWSPFLCGNAVPVSPYVLEVLQQDKTSGGAMVNVEVNGRVKWKGGTWFSGRYHIYVNCPVYIRLAGDCHAAIGVAAPAVKFQILQNCIVDV